MTRLDEIETAARQAINGTLGEKIYWCETQDPTTVIKLVELVRMQNEALHNLMENIAAASLVRNPTGKRLRSQAEEALTAFKEWESAKC